MRMLRHDVRDIPTAFGLAFDLQRVTQAGAALSWTLLVTMGVFTLLAWRIDGSWLSVGGVFGAWQLLVDQPWTPTKALVAVFVLGGWWTGFAYLCAPVQRSAAMDIARDERDRNPNIPFLSRQAAFVPAIAMIPPALCFLLLLLWSLLTYIPGATGGVLVGITLPLALVLVVFGASFMVVAIAAAPLMGPAATIEGRDYLEALSRAMSYVMQRPGRYFAYWAAKLGVVAASLLVGGLVLGVAWGMVCGAMWMVGQGDLAMAAMREATIQGTGRFEGNEAALTIGMVFWATVFLLVSWLMVVGLSSDVLIYLLMRYRVDGVTFDKITVAEEELKKFKTATETAEEAEEARKRFDDQQEKQQAGQKLEKPESEAQPTGAEPG
ncbi:MAG: hypothetical protein R3E76_11450 [Planctomycetota bacterium]